ncbi:hypothetical protein CWI42_020770 [Ordospora colligata]|uniref:Uncharacterized protein n=1 Tax=Ordospora colligata OC4 TaxID=1354746 RepID=A0A0B2UMJ2_9MICR|nr:uncharacterized protein M896_020780 [Ordospora colligata OC4]KHN70242.1 hypothetical protein M896_020780 [Ordospora colligata OC4]TBU16786.1 hypothetical protein CWI41_020790 [Ordospora colligata]TBU19335.1 hypothetical protein CWI42_020770 [Ordospora colligata]
MLNGDNRKIFICDRAIYKIREEMVEEYDKSGLVMIRARSFHKFRVAKRYGERYYFLTRGSVLVYEDLFGEPLEEVEVYGENVVDFHVHEGKVFSLVRRIGRCIGFDDLHEIMFDFQSGAYFWDEGYFYISTNKNLSRFDIATRHTEEILKDVSIKYFIVNFGMIVYVDNANIIQVIKKNVRLSYHYHSHAVVGIVVTPLESLLVVSKNKKLTRLETRRDERMALSSFDGDVVDFVYEGECVYVLTAFSLVVYDMKSGTEKGRVYSLPNFEYCKLFRAKSTEEEDPGKEIFERNVKKTKVVIPYVFLRDENMISERSLVVIKGSYVFLYDLDLEEVEKVAYFEGADCFYSNGCVITMSGRMHGGRTMKTYRIGGEGMRLMQSRECVNVANVPEDIVLDGDRLLMYFDGSFVEVVEAGILRRLKTGMIRQIEETEGGVFVLDGRGICKIGTGEWILEDKEIASFCMSGKMLFVSFLGDGVIGFQMQDGASEEKLVEDVNVIDVFSKDSVMVTSHVDEDVVILRRYRKHGEEWIKDKEMSIGDKISKVVHENVYLSVANKLHKVGFE